MKFPWYRNVRHYVYSSSKNLEKLIWKLTSWCQLFYRESAIKQYYLVEVIVIFWRLDSGVILISIIRDALSSLSFSLNWFDRWVVFLLPTVYIVLIKMCKIIIGLNLYINILCQYWNLLTVVCELLLFDNTIDDNCYLLRVKSFSGINSKVGRTNIVFVVPVKFGILWWMCVSRSTCDNIENASIVWLFGKGKIFICIYSNFKTFHIFTFKIIIFSY